MVTQVKDLDIKIMRLKAGLRQYDVAAWVGNAPNRLSEFESGRREPSPELLQHILEVIKADSDVDRAGK